jgi:hypothetical protein
MLADMTPPPKKKEICRVIEVRDSLEPADAKIFDSALENLEDWNSEALTRELNKRGLIISVKTIRGHRNGDCVCVHA